LLQEHAPDAVVTRLSAEFLGVYLGTFKRGLNAYRISTEEKEDLAQEVRVRALCAFRTMPIEGVRRWLCTLLKHKALDTLRRCARHAAQRLEAPVGSGQSPEDAVQSAWDSDFIRELLDRLREQVPEEHYLVFYLRTMEECPVAQVAHLTGLTAHGVRRISGRVKQRLERLALFYGGKEYRPNPDP
jgi:RNA polymerase sigma factor (sigma-70 family)